MPTLPPPKSARPSETTPPVTTLRRWAHRLRVTLIEREIIDHILDNGRDRRWTMYTGTNLAAEIGCLIGMHRDHVSRGMVSLTNRGWLKSGTNDVGQRYVQLTKEFVDASSQADNRWAVRRALGATAWKKINGDDQIADKLFNMAKDMTHARYKDRVRAAVAEYIIDTGSGKLPTDESSVPSRRIVSSQLTNRQFTLIKGERESSA
jgi:hypothetical protein